MPSPSGDGDGATTAVDVDPAIDSNLVKTTPFDYDVDSQPVAQAQEVAGAPSDDASPDEPTAKISNTTAQDKGPPTDATLGQRTATSDDIAKVLLALSNMTAKFSDFEGRLESVERAKHSDSSKRPPVGG